jgi:hypothetical protein
MSRNGQATRPAGRVTYVRDDIWCIRAGALVVVGLIFAAVGFLPEVGLGVSSVGLACMAFGIWVVARPVGLVIDTPTASMSLRGLVTERHVMFSDLSYVGVQLSEQGMSERGWLRVAGARYDVIVHLRRDQVLVLRRDLQLSAARLAAERLGALTGAAVSESSRTSSPDSYR